MMTDKEIITRLENCGFNESACCDCPIAESCEKNTDEVIDMVKSTLDLIKEQQEEIELLRAMDEKNTDVIHNLAKKLHSLRMDTIKEFAEKLKEVNKSIDDFRKEMLGEE